VRTAVDSSVAVAAILADHEAHELAEDALSGATSTIAQVAAETYSVLTRLPPPLRVDPRDAAAIIEARLPSRWLTLDARGHRSALRRLGAATIAAGATYDALIALTASAHDTQLLSRDRRAARTYRALGTSFQLLAP
jgi:predicted nucleic acid-binding protein